MLYQYFIKHNPNVFPRLARKSSPDMCDGINKQPQIIGLNSFLVLLCLLMTGCQIVGPNYQRPSSSLPDQYTASMPITTTDQAVTDLSQWWTYFQDETLNGLVIKGLQRNSDIAIAASRIEEADAVLREVGAAVFPQANLQSAASRSKVTELGAFPVFNGLNPRSSYSASISSSFELDLWGKLRRSTEQARAQLLASRYAKSTVEWTLSGLIASQYLQLRSLDAQTVMLNDNIGIRRRNLELVKQQLIGGIITPLAVYQAEAALANLEAQLTDVKRLRGIAENQLSLLTAEPGLTIAVADIATIPIPPVPPAGLPSILLESRPDIMQAEQVLIANNAKIGVAKAALYPTISLTGQLGAESLELGNLVKSGASIWNLGGNLSLPIFDSGRRKAKIAQAEAQQQQALLAYQQALRSAFVDVSNALVNLRYYTEREHALDLVRASSGKAMQMADQRYKNGYVSYLEVLDAQRNFNESSLSYVQARQLRLAAIVDLFKALGGGWNR